MDMSLGKRQAYGSKQHVRSYFGGVVALAMCLLAGPAQADDRATAEALFATARGLAADGKEAEACEKYRAAFALYESPSTKIQIARCSEREGNLATAWGDYKHALALNRATKPADRRLAIAKIANDAIATLAPRVPKLTITITDAPDDVEVRRDSVVLPNGSLGVQLPVDPGEHTIFVRAAGYRDVSRQVMLTEGQSETVSVVLLPSAGAGSGSAGSGSAGAGALGSAAPGADGVADGAPVWPWVVGGLGVASLAVSVIFLADDLDAISALRENCPEEAGVVTCTPGYDFAADNARKNRGFGLFVAFGVLGAGAVTAAIVGLTSSADDADESAAATWWVTPWVAPVQRGWTAGTALEVTF